MIKVAMIGAGSVVFSKNLTGDILSYPEFKDASFSYMDIDPERLEVGGNLCRKAAKALNANPRIETTLDRRKALEGADFVINMVQIGGFGSTLIDFEIPRKYGLNFTIADTTGPGGLFRALRTFPLLRGLCRDMEEVCPNAVLLNYSNPMSMNMQSIFRTSNVSAVGLCHSVQGTFNQLMRYIGEDPSTAAFICAGINHMAFYTKIEKNHQDLYPRIFKAMEDPAKFNTNRVRFELMKRLGYFITESSEHNAEYCSYFIPRGQEKIHEFAVPIDEYLRRCDRIVSEFERMIEVSKNDKPMEFRRSHEYGSTIIHSIVTGKPSVVYGNMVNNGAISNLPKNAIVEAPTLVDRAGLQFTTVGELPPQLVAYMQPHISQHELFIRAALEGRRDHVYQAAMFDPLTAATLPLDKIVEMCDELIGAHGEYLPKLEHKSLVPGSGRHFGAVDPKQMQRNWNEVKAKDVKDYIKSWHVIGPFKGPVADQISLELKTPVEDDFLTSADGKVDLKKSYDVAGCQLRWKEAKADDDGCIDFDVHLERVEFAVAYGYVEVESVHAREVFMGCGSDDGIKVWVNGKIVFENETARGYTPNSDRFKARLNAGINRIFVKIDNKRNGWGFGVSIPEPHF